MTARTKRKAQLPEGDGQEAFGSLLDHLRKTRGFACDPHRRRSVEQGVRARMAAVGVTHYGDYQDRLEARPDEPSKLFDEILGREAAPATDPSSWSVLERRIVPELLGSKGHDDPIRIWSADGVSGSEILAILFADAMGLDEYNRRVRIFCTDGDAESVARARRTTYAADDPLLAIAANLHVGISDLEQKKYLERSEGGWRLGDRLRRNLVFGQHDLVRNPPIAHVDLLLCPNVLFRLNDEDRREASFRIHFALQPRGILVLGSFDAASHWSDLFAPIDEDHRILEKRPREWRSRAAREAARREDALDPDPVPSPPEHEAASLHHESTVEDARRELMELQREVKAPLPRKQLERVMSALSRLREFHERLGARAEQLGARAEELERIFDLAPSPLVVTDLDGRILRMNQHAGSLLGTAVRREQNLSRWLVPTEHPRLHRLLERLRLGEATLSFLRNRFHFVGRKENPVDGDVSVGRVGGAGEPGTFLVWSVQDVSGPMKAERTVRSLLSRLLAAEDDTRREIGRELHDSVGQILAAASMDLDRVAQSANRLGREEAHALERAMTLLDEVSRDLRALSYTLHAPLLEDLGLVGALESVVRGLRSRGKIQIDLQLPTHFHRPSVSVERLLYRVAQEGLTNVLRHSGSDQATVRLRQLTRRIILEIEDRGRGFPEQIEPGVGIVGMRERLAEVGGTLEIRSDRSGAILRAVVPVDRKRALPGASESAGEH